MLKNLWDLTKLIEYLPLFFHKSLKICQQTLLISFFLHYTIFPDQLKLISKLIWDWTISFLYSDHVYSFYFSI